MKKSVILLCCHYVTGVIIKRFNDITRSCAGNFDVVLVCDTTKKTPRISDRYPHHFFNVDSIKTLGYKMYEGHIWYHGDYAILDFFIKNPGYEYYWRVEYDVGFAGSWDTFFNSFLDDHTDFLGIRVRKYEEDPQWAWWTTAFQFAVDKDKRMAAFFPVNRFSNRALKMLDAKYKSGFYGFCEATVPTLINSEGFTVKDIGNRFYDDETFSYTDYAVNKPDKLLHRVYSGSVFQHIKWMLGKRPFVQKLIKKLKSKLSKASAQR